MDDLKLSLYINKCFKKGVNSIVINNNIITISVERSKLCTLLRYLKNNTLLRFSQLLDLWGTDYPTRKERFEVSYMLLSLKLNKRVIVRVSCSEMDVIDSVTSIYSSAGWLERETWDMYGVYFVGNPDLRRILTDYGFEGFPLRKDFPLSGYVETRYDDGEKRVLQEPIEVQQEFRLYNFASPWEVTKEVSKEV